MKIDLCFIDSFRKNKREYGLPQHLLVYTPIYVLCTPMCLSLFLLAFFPYVRANGACLLRRHSFLLLLSFLFSHSWSDEVNFGRYSAMFAVQPHLPYFFAPPGSDSNCQGAFPPKVYICTGQDDDEKTGYFYFLNKI